MVDRDATEIREVLGQIGFIAEQVWPSLSPASQVAVATLLGSVVDVLSPPRPVAKVFPIRGTK